ncbi:MAG TPA: helix-turn-helix domain-containing protein [Terriglobia bacterium]|nr:helix-turn-helix domain-containing protein [Terriglobia bacterium]
MAYLTRGVFEQVQLHLRVHPSSSLADLCRALHIERHTIERAVRGSTGKCFREFRREALLRSACELLWCEPGKSIKEIAFMLGFSSTRSFDRFVLTSCGHTPTKLRQSSPLNTSGRLK